MLRGVDELTDQMDRLTHPPPTPGCGARRSHRGVGRAARIGVWGAPLASGWAPCGADAPSHRGRRAPSWRIARVGRAARIGLGPRAGRISSSATVGEATRLRGRIRPGGRVRHNELRSAGAGGRTLERIPSSVAWGSPCAFVEGSARFGRLGHSDSFRPGGGCRGPGPAENRAQGLPDRAAGL